MERIFLFKFGINQGPGQNLYSKLKNDFGTQYLKLKNIKISE